MSSAYHTTQWLRQRIIGQRQRVKPGSRDAAQRLRLETKLDGHKGCVNCLEWNRAGNLLASGSDDHHIIIWDPFKRTKRHVIDTSHEGNIFSVKFLPDFSDSLIASCASDSGVKLFNSMTGINIMDCKSCHDDRVKRLEVHPSEPFLIWSAGEDGLILQYDIREGHVCNSGSMQKNLLIDLKKIPNSPVKSAKCLAANPMFDKMLAVGAEDLYVRLFDRRYISHGGAINTYTTHFAPGHVIKSSLKSPIEYNRSYGTTYLAFSPDGCELLANMHAEHTYLFNVHHPWEMYKSFETSVQPLVIDLPLPEQTDRMAKGRKIYSQWRELKNVTEDKVAEVPEKDRGFYNELCTKLKTKAPLLKKDFDKINQLLSETKHCAELYQLRASALIQRGWRGDFYQAIRDSCCALALKPLDYSSLENITCASYLMNDRESINGLLDIMKIHCAEIGPIQEATRSSMNRDNIGFFSSSQSWLQSSPDFEMEDQRVIDFRAQQDDIMVESDIHSQQFSALMYELNDSTHLKQDNCTDFTTNHDIFDYSRRYCGHCNMNTDIKEANFFGADAEFIVGGSDDGAFYIWDKETTNIVKAVHADMQTLNCLQPHPSIYMLATSGIEPIVKLWSPSGRTSHDIQSLETRCAQNQVFLNSDPLEAMIMMLGYPDGRDM